MPSFKIHQEACADECDTSYCPWWLRRDLRAKLAVIFAQLAVCIAATVLVDWQAASHQKRRGDDALKAIASDMREDFQRAIDMAEAYVSFFDRVVLLYPESNATFYRSAGEAIMGNFGMIRNIMVVESVSHENRADFEAARGQDYGDGNPKLREASGDVAANRTRYFGVRYAHP